MTDAPVLPVLPPEPPTALGEAETQDYAPSVTFPIVGIGASAGGLKALTNLLASIPDDTGMAFVVIQHLDPNHASYLPSLLAKHARIPVDEARDGVIVEPNRVYVITPNTRITIAQGLLHISPREPGRGIQLPIDAFLRSLASDRPGCSIGVILSGTGSDGTVGLAAIKSAGGITFAQDDSAEFPGMPLSAIGHGHVDFVLRPTEIATELGKIGQFGFPCLLPAPEPTDQDTDRALDTPTVVDDPASYTDIMDLLRASTRVDFTHYRSTTITRRTMRRMALLHLTTLAEYAKYLKDHAKELDELARDILIHVTSFYRDKAAFATLSSTVFPLWSADRTAETPIRLWVVGCSTGQEVYSLAIELTEHLTETSVTSRVQIFATDISDWALAKARLGSYPESIADQVPPDRLARYFTREATGYKITKAIRDLCVFAKHDVTCDTPFSHMDLISCRNVLIYLGPVLQDHVLPTFHFSLNPGGFLLLGTSETLGKSAGLYATIDERNRLYRSIASPRRLSLRPSPPPRAGETGMSPPSQPFSSPVSEMQRAADLIVLGLFAPAGVLITDSLEIIQFRGNTNPFLQPPQGDVSLDLLAMVPFGVAAVLREAVSEAKQHRVPVRRERVTHCRDNVLREISIAVIPIRLPTNITCFLVLFEEPLQSTHQLPLVSTAITPSPAEPSGGAAFERENSQLRLELAAATNYIRSLTGLNHELGEQLKESQEEAQSGSEEYRSTNEELQTAKEEVESTNQELITINDELRAVNGDLGQTSSALRTSGKLTSAIVETMRYPLLVLTPDLRVDRANQAFLDEFKVDRQETIGRLIYDLGNSQWNIPELRRLLEDILPSNSAFDDFEVTHDFGHIGRRTMLLNARRLQGDDDESLLIVLVIADITERTRNFKHLQDSSDEQLRSNAELDQFAAVASHDLKEPLRMMSNYIGILERRYGSLFDDRARGYMAHVTNGAQRMSEMIEAILMYSRLGHEATGVIDIDSTQAVEHAMISLTDKMESTQGTILHAGLPRVLANLEQLTQLFQNLISNALKFHSPHRLPVVRISATVDEHEWIFAVADNGVGMEESDYGKIFDLFHRAHVDRDVQGCGIGLATCRKIVEHHKGRIWVESLIDVGSTFYFSLPRGIDGANPVTSALPTTR